MGLTIAHPALAIPLRRMGLLLSPLIIGSMSPDFEFFLRLSQHRLIAHTWIGVFVFCIPVSFATLWLYHSLLKHSLVSLFPHKHQHRLLPLSGPFKFFPLKRFVQILLSVFVGILTHFFWDAWTHADGWFVQQVPLLSATLVRFPHHAMKVFSFLQYATSAVGMILMVGGYARWYLRRTPAVASFYRISTAKRVIIAASIVVTAVGGGLIRGFIVIPKLPDLPSVRTIVANSAIGSGTCFMAALVIFALIWRMAGVVRMPRGGEFLTKAKEALAARRAFPVSGESGAMSPQVSDLLDMP